MKSYCLGILLLSAAVLPAQTLSLDGGAPKGVTLTDSLVSIFESNLATSLAAGDTVPAITRFIHGGTYIANQFVPEGGWLGIQGTNLADTTGDWSNQDFSKGTLPTTFNGAQVKFNGVAGALYFTSAGQLNVQVPNNLGSSVQIQVVKNGLVSNTVTATPVPRAPSFLTYPSPDLKIAYVDARTLDGTLVGDPAVYAGTVKAKPGDTLQVYGESLTTSQAGVVINAAVIVPGVTIKVGSQTVIPGFAGLVAVGEFQMNMVVPNLPDGNYIITVQIAGQSSPDNDANGQVILVIGH